MNKHHPGKIWLKTYPLGRAIHFKVVDCEYGEQDDAHIIHLIYHTDSQSWSGFLQQDINRFVVSPREAKALFASYFNLES